MKKFISILLVLELICCAFMFSGCEEDTSQDNKNKTDKYSAIRGRLGLNKLWGFILCI